MRNVKAFTLVELLVVMGIIALLMGLFLPALSRARESAKRTQCASNLRQIGMAITMYADANGGYYPRTYFVPDCPEPHNSLGNHGADVTIEDRRENAFTINPKNPESSVGRNNVPAALFLLITTQKLPPEVFICPSAAGQTDTFRNSRSLSRGNFTGDGQEPNGSVTRNLNYGYANPYPNRALSRYRLTTGLDARFPIMADMGPGVTPGHNPWASRYMSSGTRLMGIMNSLNHDGVGQNVLYADGRVEFKLTPFAGIEYDNIYVADTSHGKWGPMEPNDDITIRAWVPGEDKSKDAIGPAAESQVPLDMTDSVMLPWAQM